MAGQSKGSKKRRRAGKGRAEQNARTQRNVQRRRLKFERRIKAQIEEEAAGNPLTSKAERLRAHLAWSIGMRKRWN